LTLFLFRTAVSPPSFFQNAQVGKRSLSSSKPFFPFFDSIVQCRSRIRTRRSLDSFNNSPAQSRLFPFLNFPFPPPLPFPRDIEPNQFAGYILTTSPLFSGLPPFSPQRKDESRLKDSRFFFSCPFSFPFFLSPDGAWLRGELTNRGGLTPLFFFLPPFSYPSLYMRRLWRDDNLKLKCPMGQTFQGGFFPFLGTSFCLSFSFFFLAMEGIG